jgi:hypothetical protein
MMRRKRNSLRKVLSVYKDSAIRDPIHEVVDRQILV